MVVLSTWPAPPGTDKQVGKNTANSIHLTLDTIILHSVGIFRFPHFWRVLDYSPCTTFHTQSLAIYMVFFFNCAPLNLAGKYPI